MSWHRPPPQMNVPAVEVSAAVFEASAYGKESRKVRGDSLVNFEPRAPQDLDVSHANVQELLDTFAAKLGKSGLFHFWEHPSLAASEADRTSEKQVKLLLVPRIPTFSSTIDELDDEVLAAMSIDYAGDSSIDASLVSYIEGATKKQAKCALWRDVRIGRTTSSIFHDILCRKASTSSDSLVKKILGYTTTPQTAAMQWGIEHESKAVLDYLRFVNADCTDDLAMRHEPSGITLHQDFSFLGASADGLLHDPASSDPHGLLEVKCPVSVDGHSVSGLPPSEISARFGNKFCLRADPGGKLVLSRTHRYYTQVRGELAVMDKEWGDFLLWTNAPFPTNLFVERIFRDRSYWEGSLLPKLQDFYIGQVVPEILSRRLYAEQHKDRTALSDPNPAATACSSTSPMEVSEVVQGLDTTTSAASCSDLNSPVPSMPTGSSKSISQTLSRTVVCCNSQCVFKELKPKPCRNSSCRHHFHHICTTDDMGNFCMHCFA